MFKISSSFQIGLEAAGVDPATLLRRSGLPLALWSSGKGMVTTGQFFALWRTLGEINSDPSIGLKLARLIPHERHHPVSIAAQHARTFRDALQRMARYKVLCCSEEIRMIEDRDECRLEFTWLLSREFAPPLLLDAVFASTLELGRRGTGVTLHPIRVELARPATHREMHESHYGCRVKFKAGRNSITYRRSDLDRPFLTYNADLLALLGHELAEWKAGQTTADRVKWILLRLLGGHRPDVAAVAKDLGMSIRTLQRRITAEGTSFRRLVSEARRDLAKQYLLQPALEPGETACLLGYDDPNSFYRAFREWEGLTPGEWKASQRARQA